MKSVAFCGKQNKDYVASLKNAVSFFVAQLYRMNFIGAVY